jgi:predicted MFS family arabinose efflux permease
VVGTVLSGLLIGILLARTVSGFVAGVAGWRAIYVVAAGTALVLTVLLRRAIPAMEPRVRLPYPALLASVLGIVRRERVVRWSLVLGGAAFAVFTMFWTALTFLLSAPPFSYPVQTIGLFGLVGLAGAVTAQRAGRLHDRGLGLWTMGAAWVLLLVAFVVAGLAGGSVVLVVVAVLLLDVAVQAHQISAQARVFAVDPTARSRINTAFLTNGFLCGAIGSGLATVLWTHGGWTAITLTGAGISGFALTVWLVGRRGALELAAAPAR